MCGILIFAMVPFTALSLPGTGSSLGQSELRERKGVFFNARPCVIHGKLEALKLRDSFRRSKFPPDVVPPNLGYVSVIHLDIHFKGVQLILFPFQDRVTLRNRPWVSEDLKTNSILVVPQQLSAFKTGPIPIGIQLYAQTLLDV